MEHRRQPYDSTLKALLQENAERILPRWIPGLTVIETLDVEVLSPARRADRVFLAQLNGAECLVEMELESSADPYIEERLHAYAANLALRYHRQVISMVVYPFRVTMPQSPLRWHIGTYRWLEFGYHVVALWQMHAYEYVQQHAIEMYPLLPSMEGVTIELLGQALQEMSEAYQNDEAKLAQQLIWMGILLRRSSTISSEAKLEIRRRLNMFDRLLEEDERVIQLREESEARGEARGEVRGEARGREAGLLAGKAQLVTTIIEARFPTFVEEAQRKVPRVRRPEQLDQLARMVVTAPDENALRWLLDSMVA